MSNRDNNLTRLHVFIARSGAASRRAAESLIAAGRVGVNGITVSSMGIKVSPSDKITLDGKILEAEGSLHYFALNKPEGYICASSDPEGRPLALQLLPPLKERLYSIGRLDFRSSGLIIFTNDGIFASKIGHPSSNIEKEYFVESTVPIPDGFEEDFLKGINIDSIVYKASNIKRLDNKTLEIILTEGKNKEIRRVFSHYRLHPRRLLRVRIGPVKLGTLEEGKTRALTKPEKQKLENIIAESKGR